MIHNKKICFTTLWYANSFNLHLKMKANLYTIKSDTNGFLNFFSQNVILEIF